MTTVNNTIKHVMRYCEKQGLRLTSKRKKVLSGLLSSKKALSAYELVDYCKNEFDEAIPAMSVYRILNFLESEHMVHKLSLANKYVACSHIVCEHMHEVSQFLICTECQRVKEINIGRSTVRKIHEEADKEGFSIVNPQLEINCLCKSCVTNNN